MHTVEKSVLVEQVYIVYGCFLLLGGRQKSNRPGSGTEDSDGEDTDDMSSPRGNTTMYIVDCLSYGYNIITALIYTCAQRYVYCWFDYCISYDAFELDKLVQLFSYFSRKKESRLHICGR